MVQHLNYMIPNSNTTQTNYKQLEQKQSYDYLIKLLIIGDSGVGKSSILLQFVENTFTDNFISTIGIDFRVRTIVIDGKRIKLQVWDTGGQDRFKTITKAYYRGAMGIILVYDVTDETSLLNIKEWIDDIKTSITSDTTSDIVIVANKCDLDNKMAVDYTKGKALAEEYGMKFFKTSAKDSTSVENVFLTIAKDIKMHIFDKLPNTISTDHSVDKLLDSSDTPCSCTII